MQQSYFRQFFYIKSGIMFLLSQKNYRWDIEPKNLLAISRSVIFDNFVSSTPESSYPWVMHVCK